MAGQETNLSNPIWNLTPKWHQFGAKERYPQSLSTQF